MKKLRVFRKVAYHLLTQNKKSESEDACWYKFDTDPAIRCAIGCLIRDQYYNKDLEGKSVDDIEVQNALSSSLKEPITNRDRIFLSELQMIHDYVPVKDWDKELNQFAIDNFDKTIYEMELI